MNAPFAITMGDPCGIGPEIIVKLFASMSDRPPALVIGDVGVIERTVLALGGGLRVVCVARPEDARPKDRIIEVIQAGQELRADIAPGRVEMIAGKAAFDAIVEAARLAVAGRVKAIVTAPLCKEALHAAGVPYPGHTEALAALSGAAEVRMMMVSSELRVVLATVHVRLAAVPALVTEERELVTIRLANDAARRLGASSPRVAVAALNPHAGEGGLFGLEESQIINPAIRRARKEGVIVSGPLPGDTVFMKARRGEFDIVVAQYHDQGLIPFKYLGIDTGVNVTLGLPFVRTSVDHGTAFDIAGKGQADPSSLEKALRQALSMTRSAAELKEAT